MLYCKPATPTTLYRAVANQIFDFDAFSPAAVTISNFDVRTNILQFSGIDPAGVSVAPQGGPVWGMVVKYADGKKVFLKWGWQKPIIRHVASPFPAGLRLVACDDFPGTSLDRSTWPVLYGGGLYWNKAFSWSRADVAVAGGELVVSNTRHADGTWTAGGLNMLSTHGITRGRVEFCAAFEAGQGTGFALLIWPTGDHWPPEFDLVEVPRGNRQSISITNHWMGPRGNNDNQMHSKDFAVDATQWHQYCLDWTENYFRLFVDGTLAAEFTEHIAAEMMTFGLMGYVAAAGESWYGGGPDATTPPVVRARVRSVRVYQAL